MRFFDKKCSVIRGFEQILVFAIRLKYRNGRAATKESIGELLTVRLGCISLERNRDRFTVIEEYNYSSVIIGNTKCRDNLFVVSEFEFAGNVFAERTCLSILKIIESRLIYLRIACKEEYFFIIVCNKPRAKRIVFFEFLNVVTAKRSKRTFFEIAFY